MHPRARSKSAKMASASPRSPIFNTKSTIKAAARCSISGASSASLARRVLRIVELSSARLLLEVERFGQSKPGRLEFASSAVRTEAKLTREQFSEEFQIFCTNNFPTKKSNRSPPSGSRVFAFTAIHARHLKISRSALGRDRRGSGRNRCRHRRDVHIRADLARSFARTRRRPNRRPAIIFSARWWRLLAHRTAALAPNLRIELYELDESRRRGRLLNAGELGNFATRLTPRRESKRCSQARTPKST